MDGSCTLLTLSTMLLLQEHNSSHINIQFNHLQRNVLVSYRTITTLPQRPHFNVLSGVLTECLVEPWQVGVGSTARRLLVNTVLSIPQGVVSVEVTMITALFPVLGCLTVVVTANVGLLLLLLQGHAFERLPTWTSSHLVCIPWMDCGPNCTLDLCTYALCTHQLCI